MTVIQPYLLEGFFVRFADLLEVVGEVVGPEGCSVAGLEGDYEDVVHVGWLLDDAWNEEDLFGGCYCRKLMLRGVGISGKYF